jgi:hypothetical protein
MRPTRIVDEDRFEATLLRSALGEEPPRGAIGRAEAALRIGAGAGIGVTAAATAAAKTATVQLGAAHTVAQIGAGVVAKWVGVGVVTGLVVTGGAEYAASPALHDLVFRRPVPSRSAPVVQRPAARARVLTPKAAPSEAVASEPPSEPGPDESLSAEVPPAELEAAPEIVSEAPARPSHRDAARVAENAPARVASIAHQVSIIERARRALAAHQPDVVLREVETYAHTHESAVFAPEAEMLAIEALLQQGNVSAAKQRAQRALRGAPGGSHATRLREIAALGR